MSLGLTCSDCGTPIASDGDFDLCPSCCGDHDFDDDPACCGCGTRASVVAEAQIERTIALHKLAAEMLRWIDARSARFSGTAADELRKRARALGVA
jgi:hypothetical protein